jgi:hypothetical protein
MVTTWFDLIRIYFPNATDEYCDYILWEKTTFPLGSFENLERQIKEFAMQQI